MVWPLWLLVALAGVALIVWGAETFAKHLAVASTRLGVSAFALALLLAGAEPEELATVVTASLRNAPAIAFGDVIGANIAICLVALGVGALIAPLPFDKSVIRYGLGGLAAGTLAAYLSWNGTVIRFGGVVLIAAYVAFVAVIWMLERRPPTLGETAELDEAAGSEKTGRFGIELVLVLAGVAAMAVGATAVAVRYPGAARGVRYRGVSLGRMTFGFAETRLGPRRFDTAVDGCQVLRAGLGVMRRA